MTGLLSTPARRAAGLMVGLLVLALLAAVSVSYGALATSWRTVIEAYTQFNGSNEHLVITEVRVPRTAIALAVGASLGMAGALLQMLTRNPLADPEVFGLNAARPWPSWWPSASFRSARLPRLRRWPLWGRRAPGSGCSCLAR